VVREGVSSAIRRGILAYQHRLPRHVAVHVLDSETEAYGLTDSPLACSPGFFIVGEIGARVMATWKAYFRAITF